MRWYKGIKQYYPRLRFLPLKLRALLASGRPLTLTLPLIGGYLVIQASLPSLMVPTPDPFRTGLSLLVLTAFNFGGNQVNSVFDVEIDRVNKPTRPLPSGLLSRREVTAFGLGLMALAGLLSLTRLGNPTFVALALLILALTLCYSAPPIRLKKRLWWNVGSQAFIRGVLGPLAAWSIYAPLTKEAFGISIVMFLFILAAQSSKDFGDEPGDRLYGVRTLPIAYGVEGAKRIMTYLLPLPYIAALVLVWAAILPQGFLLSIISAPIAFWIPRGVGITSEKIENQWGWIDFYACMLTFLLVAALTL